MKKHIIFICTFLIYISTMAQDHTPVFFRDDDSKKNTIGLGMKYAYTLYGELSYNRIVRIKSRNVGIGIGLSTPALLLLERNKKIAFSASTYLLKSKFNIRSQMSISTNFYDDVSSSGQFMDASVGVSPGFYESNFFVSTELSYTNNIFTTFNFSDINPFPERDILLFNTVGNFKFGIQGGVLLKDRYEIKSSLIYNISRNFRNYSPYTQNIGLKLSINYWI